MDIESTSIVSLLIINGLVLGGVFIYYCFFYKWDNKTYDDLAENIGNRYDKGPSKGRGVTLNGDLFIGEEASNIESLLGKDDASVQYMPSG